MKSFSVMVALLAVLSFGISAIANAETVMAWGTIKEVYPMSRNEYGFSITMSSGEGTCAGKWIKIREYTQNEFNATERNRHDRIKQVYAIALIAYTTNAPVKVSFLETDAVPNPDGCEAHAIALMQQ